MLFIFEVSNKVKNQSRLIGIMSLILIIFFSVLKYMLQLSSICQYNKPSTLKNISHKNIQITWYLTKYGKVY